MPTIETSTSRRRPLGSFAETSSPPVETRSGRRRSFLRVPHSRTGAELRVRAHRRQRLGVGHAPSCNRGWRTRADETSASFIQMLRVGDAHRGFPSTNASSCGGTLCEVPRESPTWRPGCVTSFWSVASPFARIEVSPPPCHGAALSTVIDSRVAPYFSREKVAIRRALPLIEPLL